MNKLLRGRRRRLPFHILIVFIVLAVFLVFEGYRWVMPFVAKNPMYHDATIGETVIDNWRYGGIDQEGYLRFYDTSGGQPITLPPTEKLFGADGKFVVIEKADPSSITFAEPLEGAPPIWYAAMAFFVAAALWLIMFRVRMKRRHRMNLRKSVKRQSYSSINLTPPRRFRARRFRR